MRREKLIRYGWIADNTRWMRKPTTWDGLEEFFEHSAQFYRQAMWSKAPVYVELWCEKDAIAGVLSRETSRYDVPLMVARGYSSETFAYEAAEDIRATGKPAYVYYVGDFDPSGWQDLERRLAGFGAEFTLRAPDGDPRASDCVGSDCVGPADTTHERDGHPPQGVLCRVRRGSGVCRGGCGA